MGNNSGGDFRNLRITPSLSSANKQMQGKLSGN
jgi:hypothetical protein